MTRERAPRPRTGVRLDPSGGSVVWVCDDCGDRGISPDRGSARRAAAAHERRTHPGHVTASNALAKWTTRHAG